MLEIGLGCRMSYGPGASCNVWQEYFPSVKVHMLEFDFECYQKWKETERLRNVTVHIGDQGDAMEWVRRIPQLGTNLRLVVDDGGHENNQLCAE